MIKFEKVRWKNFLSTGNQFTEIDLNRNETTLIIGENGAGKSTVLDALCFALFGKPFRVISKSQLVNTVNGTDTIVEIEFVIQKNILNKNIAHYISIIPLLPLFIGSAIFTILLIFGLL